MLPLDDTAADKNQELHGEGNEREVFAVRAPGDAATARSGAYDAEFEVDNDTKPLLDMATAKP